MTSTLPTPAANPAREHERYLAGAAMRGADEAADIQALVRVTDFADYPARLVVQSAFDLLLAGREPTAEAVYLLLAARNAVADLGPDPIGFLAELLDRAPTGANIRFAAGQVQECSVRRQHLHLAATVMAEATRPTGSAEELTAMHERGLRDIAETNQTTVPTHISEAIRAAQWRYDHPVAAAVTTTGVPQLDGYLAGGFRRGELVLIGARPGIGKSAAALSFATAAARSDVGALFVSLEMSADELTDRFLSAETGVPLTRLRGGRQMAPNDAERMVTGTLNGRLTDLPLWFDYRPQLTVGQIAATVRRHVRRHDVRFVVVDYLQLIAPEDRKAPRYEQVGAISRGLKLLAKDAGVTVFAAAQLNREGDAYEVPRLSHLRESGSLEQDADVVLLLHVTETDHLRAVWDVDLILAKQRNGPSGVTVTLALHRPNARFAPRVPL